MWTDDFFFGPFLDVHLSMEASPDEVTFLERALDVGSGDRILDVPCGKGRHALRLAARGYRVTGVDFQPDAIARGTREAEERGLEVDLRVGDMRALAVGDGFDAAFCFWGSFGYFDGAGDRAFVDGVHRALRDGGRFLVDLHVAETLFPVYEPRSWHWWGEGDARSRVFEERRWDPDTGRVEVEWTFQRGGVEKSARSSIRIYTYRELAELLRDAGFRDVEGMETFTGAPFELGCDRLSMVATK